MKWAQSWRATAQAMLAVAPGEQACWGRVGGVQGTHVCGWMPSIRLTVCLEVVGSPG